MAAGTKSQFVIYHEEYYAGVWEGISQNIDGFNAASNNTIRLIAQDKKGDYEKESYFKTIAGLIRHRDTSSLSSIESKRLEMGEFVSPKVNRGIGPVENSLDSFRKIAKDDREFSFILGKMVGQQKAQDMLNTGILCAEAAIQNVSGLTYDCTTLSVKTIKTASLNRALSLFGDQAERIKMWVMHSTSYHDLVGEQIGINLSGVSDRIIYGGTPGTYLRPVLISDSPALWDLNGSAADTYNILGLVEGAVTITESEEQEIEVQKKLGGDNMTVIMQGEYAFNVTVKGSSWNVGTGGENPENSELSTATNWTVKMADKKDQAGVRIVHRAAA